VVLDLFAEVSGEDYDVVVSLCSEKPELMGEVRFSAHGYHRLRHRFRHRPEARPQPTGENDDLHWRSNYRRRGRARIADA